MESPTAFSESGSWHVDVDGNTIDGQLIVTMRSGPLYVEFWCSGLSALAMAESVLRDPGPGSHVQLGSFVSGARVELTPLGEPQALYIAVTEPEGCTMCYELSQSQSLDLANALHSIRQQLSSDGA